MEKGFKLIEPILLSLGIDGIIFFRLRLVEHTKRPARPVLQVAHSHVELRREHADVCCDRVDDVREARISASVRDQNQRRA